MNIAQLTWWKWVLRCCFVFAVVLYFQQLTNVSWHGVVESVGGHWWFLERRGSRAKNEYKNWVKPTFFQVIVVTTHTSFSPPKFALLQLTTGHAVLAVFVKCSFDDHNLHAALFATTFTKYFCWKLVFICGHYAFRNVSLYDFRGRQRRRWRRWRRLCLFIVNKCTFPEKWAKFYF